MTHKILNNFWKLHESEKIFVIQGHIDKFLASVKNDYIKNHKKINSINMLNN